MSCRLVASLVASLYLTVGIAPDAVAEPARIIILRHGEKADPYRLCDVGMQRSLALTSRYLGRGAGFAVAAARRRVNSARWWGRTTNRGRPHRWRAVSIAPSSPDFIHARIRSGLTRSNLPTSVGVKPRVGVKSGGSGVSTGT